MHISFFICIKKSTLISKKLLTVDKDANGKLLLTSVPLKDIQAVALTFAQGVEYANEIADIAWAEDEKRLYISAKSSKEGLDGIIAWKEAPLGNGEGISEFRSTSFFSSHGDWDRSTNAPIEILKYARINGKGYLIGDNTCSPGFGHPTDYLRAHKTPITFKETFNFGGGRPDALYTITSGGNTFLIIHYWRHKKIPQKFIDGTYNGADAVVPPTEIILIEEAIIAQSSITAPYGENKVLVISAGENSTMTVKEL